MRKKVLSIVLTLAFVVGIVQGSMVAHASIQEPSSWAAESVELAIMLDLVPQGLQNQYTQAITRAEFATLAVMFYEFWHGEITGRNHFSDTSNVYVQKAAYLGLVTGVGNNMFSPNTQLTREQAATMLSRLATSVGAPLPTQLPTFVDNSNIAQWAFNSVGQVQSAEIMGGIGGNTFSPQGPYTREQSIVTIMRLMDFIMDSIFGV